MVVEEDVVEEDGERGGGWVRDTLAKSSNEELKVDALSIILQSE